MVHLLFFQDLVEHFQLGLIRGWLHDLQSHVLFNSISVISGRLCAMEPHLWLNRVLPQAEIKVRTIRLAVQMLTH